MENVKVLLQVIALLFAVVLIPYNVYSGVTIQEVGIPGFAMVKFGSQSPPEPSRPTASAPSQPADQALPPDATEPDSAMSAATGCVVTISNSLVPLQAEPDSFSQQLIQVEVSDYPVLEYTERSFANRNQGWFKITVDGRTGWIRNDTWTIAKKTSACP